MCSSKDKTVNQDSAIIGISIRTRCAKPYEFWENLKNEKKCIHFYTDEELEKLGVSPEVFQIAQLCVKAKGRIETTLTI